MKYLIAILFLIGCSKTTPPIIAPQKIFVHDTVVVHDTVRIVVYDTVKLACSDSLKSKLFVAEYKVERVRYYLKICLRNPSQDKFLKGWIKRAID